MLRNLAESNRQLTSRFVDFAVEFIELDRDQKSGLPVPTGRRSGVYGGRWDTLAVDSDGRVGAWVDDVAGDDLEVLELYASPAQYGVLTDDESKHILLLGSRRSSKTETLARWLLKQICIWPRKSISQLVSKMKKARKLVEAKLLPLIPNRWLIKGGYRRRPDEVALLFRNGSRLDCLTGQVIDDARGDGVPALGVDERQIIDKKCVENAFLSCSEGGDQYQTCETGTALAGEFEEYWMQSQVIDAYRSEVLSVTDNVFLGAEMSEKHKCYIPLFVRNAEERMDRRLFEQEIGKFDPAAKRFIPQFCALSGTVYPEFEWSTHCRPFADRISVLQTAYGHCRGLGDDITSRICSSRFRIAAKNIIGLDWGIQPMVANVWRILRSPDGVPDILWCIDEIILETDGSSKRMSMEMKRRGYPGRTTLVIADASDNQAPSNYRIMRQAGYSVIRPGKDKTNPFELDRVNAVNAKILNKNDDITLYVDADKAPTTARALQRQALDDRGKPARDDHNHRMAAAGYVVVKLYPAASVRRKVIYAANAAI